MHAVGVAPVPRPGGAERGAGQQGDRGPAREQIYEKAAQLQIEKAGGSLGDAAPDAPRPPPAEATSKAQWPPRAVGRGHGREDGQDGRDEWARHEDGRDAVFGEARSRGRLSSNIVTVPGERQSREPTPDASPRV